jgi:hypothetical protein
MLSLTVVTGTGCGLASPLEGGEPIKEVHQLSNVSKRGCKV